MVQPILFLQKCLKISLNFKQALLLAQQLGFAESNPTLDVEGYDAVINGHFYLHMLMELLNIRIILLFTGIQNIQLSDAMVAKEKNYDIKLVHRQKN